MYFGAKRRYINRPTLPFLSFPFLSFPFSRLKFSATFLRRLVPWSSADIHGNFYGDRPRGTPPLGELNARGVDKYSDFEPNEIAISRKRCNIGGKLVLIRNRKSHMSFRLVPTSVALNDLEWRNGPYFVLFHRIRVASGGHCVKVVDDVVVKKFVVHVRYLVS